MSTSRKTALILIGAGASLDFGAPSTSALTQMLAEAVHADAWMAASGGADAYDIIAAALAGYYHGGADFVNFEHIYHCAHELRHMGLPSPGAVNEYRPALVPFIKPKFKIPSRALDAVAGFMTDRIFGIIAACCERPSLDLTSLRTFIAQIRATHTARIYTTNYDDFVLQAAPDLFTGFAKEASPKAKRFDGNAFWARSNDDSLFHLHGSVHLGFARDRREAPIGELFWYDDRRDARRDASYSGSGGRRMDGSEVTLSALITGLDKLSRLQRRPLSYFYSALSQDALKADILYVIGYGLGDLHLNTWLNEARSRSDRPPLVFVDYWADGFSRSAAFNETDRKLIEMWHALRMPIGYDPGKDHHMHRGWTLDATKTCAVWDRGFGEFLEATDEHQAVLRDLGTEIGC